MALSDDVEILLVTGDSAAEAVFFRGLGFRPVADAVLTDGGVNLRLGGGEAYALVVRYLGADLVALRARGIPVAEGEEGVTLRLPGIDVVVMGQPGDAPMPAGAPMERTPLSRCGTFGELAMPVADLDAAIAAWEAVDFASLHRADTWAILSDGLIVIGLHQGEQFSGPHLTYFAPNMAERIAAFQAEDWPVTPLVPDQTTSVDNAVLVSPGGQGLFLFTGDL